LPANVLTSTSKVYEERNMSQRMNKDQGFLEFEQVKIVIRARAEGLLIDLSVGAMNIIECKVLVPADHDGAFCGYGTDIQFVTCEM